MCVSRPARILEVAADGRAAVAEVGGRRDRVGLDLLVLQGITVRPGDWLLSNSGLAVERITESEAEELADLLEEMEDGT